MMALVNTLFYLASLSMRLTGSKNHTIVCPVNMEFLLFDGPISNYDIIGVFYENDFGEDQCAGYVVWDGTTSSIAAQGDDSTTDEIDGFGVGVSSKFKSLGLFIVSTIRLCRYL